MKMTILGTFKANLTYLTINLLLISCAQNQQNKSADFTQVNVNSITIAFYNCENLFDINHEQGKEDSDFTPDGKYHYTQKIYEQKLHNIATVLQSMDNKKHQAPAIAGLAEIENDGVLKDLCNQPELAPMHYQHICHFGPDPRGINVGFIYNPSLFKLLKEETIPVVFSNGAHSRDILHIYGILDGDTVHVFINHWTSRRGDEEKSEIKRIAAARINKEAMDAITSTDKHARIIVMGDFNDNPNDQSILSTLDANHNIKEVEDTELFNPFAEIYKSGNGTEKYNNSWNLFDQIIITGSFLNSANGHLQYNSAEIYNPEFITETSKKHAPIPHRSFAGSRWINGYSDHFPVLITLTK